MAGAVPEATATALSEESVRRAVREVLAQELTPLVEQLTTPATTTEADKQRDGDVAEQQRETVREAAGQVREELAAVLEATRAGFASLAQEVAGLRSVVDELQARPAETSEPVEVNEEHTSLLKTAARISSADLRCHRGTWEFLTTLTAGHPHFRVPPRVTDEADERVTIALDDRVTPEPDTDGDDQDGENGGPGTRLGWGA